MFCFNEYAQKPWHRYYENTPTRSGKLTEEVDNYNPAEDIQVGNTSSETKGLNK